MKGERSLFYIFVFIVGFGALVGLLKFGNNDTTINSLSLLLIFVLLAVFLKNIIYALVISFFFNIYLSYYELSSLIALILPIAFLFFRNDNTKTYITKQTKMVCLIAIVLVVPSFIFSQSYFFSIFLGFQYLLLLIVIIFLPKLINSVKEVDYSLSLFVLFSVINSFDVIITSLESGKREFGFTGIVFVDYVSISIIIIIFRVFTRKTSNEIIGNLLILIFLIIALLQTQTRGVLIPLIFTMVLMVPLLFKNELKSEKRKTIFLGLTIIFSSLVITIIMLYYFQPAIFSRFSGLVPNDLMEYNDVEDFSTNSIMTRLLIWITAINAFTNNPFWGIGPYSFPFISENYNQLPELLFTTFVQGLSVHITYLQVLTENGLIGLIGFCVFIVYFWILAYKAGRKENGGFTETKAIVFLVYTYIVFSMFITDAWLWGHQIIMLGMFIGLIIYLSYDSKQAKE